MKVLTLKCQQMATGLCSLPSSTSAVIFLGELVVSGLATFAGLVGGGVSEQGVAAGFPSGSGVGEGADDQGGFVVGVVGGADGSVFGSQISGKGCAPAVKCRVAGRGGR